MQERPPPYAPSSDNPDKKQNWGPAQRLSCDIPHPLPRSLKFKSNVRTNTEGILTCLLDIEKKNASSEGLRDATDDPPEKVWRGWYWNGFQEQRSLLCFIQIDCVFLKNRT